MNFIGGTGLGPSKDMNLPSGLTNIASPERIMVLGQLAAALSHEMAQPLFAAQNYLTVAADRCRQEQRRDHVLDESVAGALAQVDRAVQIAGHIRRFAVKGAPSREFFDLNVLLRECLDQYESQRAAGRVQVQFRPRPGILAVMADSVLVRQVVLNLLRNASEAMENLPLAERIIEVSSAVHDAAHARVTIRDCGPGLPKNTALMTKPFLTSKREGLGLGLWLSRTIVESNDGKFWAEESASGGAALSFTLLLGDGANQWKS